MIQTINIKDLPYGDSVRPNDLFPASRNDGITYKVSPLANERVSFAGENLSVGDAVYLGLDGFIYKALATDSVKSNVIGIVSRNILQFNEVFYVRSGYQLTLQSLITGKEYWLSETVPGAYVDHLPITPGSYSVKIGTGYDLNTLLVQINSGE